MIMGLSSKQVSADGLDLPQGSWKSGDMEIAKAPAVPPQAIRRQQQRQPVPPPLQQQQQWPSLRCPRCDSTNTKFCYYNNYSRSQPRHFCKACRRHWTNGGTLRNVPVGGRRKAKRPKTSHESSAPNSTADADGNIASDGNDVPTTTQSSLRLQVLLPPPLGPLLQLPLPPPDYGSNEDINSSLFSALLPIPPVPQFRGGLMTPHDVNDGHSYAPSASSSFPPPLLGFTGKDDLAGVDAGAAVSMTAPWESLPPSSCSTSGPGGGSSVTTSGGPTVLEPSSPSSAYWGSCWDDLTGFLSPDHEHPTPPFPPPQDLQLS